MRGLGLALLIWVAVAHGFHFPDEEVAVNGTTEAEYDYEDESLEPLDETVELEGRFLFGNNKPWRKLGSAATSLLNTLRGNSVADDLPSDLTPQSSDYTDYPDNSDTADQPALRGSGPSHGFPVDARGNISCARLRRAQKKRCRNARRRERQGRRQGRGRGQRGRTPSTGITASGGAVDPGSLKRAARKCCHLQHKNDMLGFNNCCQPFGFCPICKVAATDATSKCCPLLRAGDVQGYRSCCGIYGQCPYCEEAPLTAAKPAGCLYKGTLFRPGTEIAKLAHKCMFIRCKDNGNGPEVQLDYLDQVGCCQKDKDLFPPGSSISVDECTNMVCTDGKWLKQKANLAAVLASLCPEGWMDLGASCVYIWRQLMTRAEAAAGCARLQSRLALPHNQAQLTQLIAAFNNMEGRDSTKELGGWVDARHSGSQWQSSAGDTLTFQPWEKGAPDDLRRTACAGLTVTQQSQGWKDYMCDSRQHMLYPMCQVDKKGCGDENAGCGPVEGDQMFLPNSAISSGDCEIFKCDESSYVVRKVNPLCCYHHEWNGKAFGRARGWYAGLYPPGGFQPYEGLLCDCTDGVGDCTQFYDDYGDYDEEGELPPL